jgi:hypothetical protein
VNADGRRNSSGERPESGAVIAYSAIRAISICHDGAGYRAAERPERRGDRSGSRVTAGAFSEGGNGRSLPQQARPGASGPASPRAFSPIVRRPQTADVAARSGQVQRPAEHKPQGRRPATPEARKRGPVRADASRDSRPISGWHAVAARTGRTASGVRGCSATRKATSDPGRGGRRVMS